MSILYRDQWMIAINKPTGVLVHPGDDPNTIGPVAMKVLRDQIGARIWSVHRLDCPTSGVLLYSLSANFLPHIRKLFELGEVQKTYNAIVLGETPEAWVCDQDLQKADGEPFRASKTRIVRKSVWGFAGLTLSLLMIEPVTGRYHQIRKHLAMSGHPIVGDYRYGEKSINTKLEKIVMEFRLMLHASQLVFNHPITSEELIINAPLPKRFNQIKS